MFIIRIMLTIRVILLYLAFLCISAAQIDGGLLKASKSFMFSVKVREIAGLRLTTQGRQYTARVLLMGAQKCVLVLHCIVVRALGVLTAWRLRLMSLGRRPVVFNRLLGSLTVTAPEAIRVYASVARRIRAVIEVALCFVSIRLSTLGASPLRQSILWLYKSCSDRRHGVLELKRTYAP